MFPSVVLLAGALVQLAVIRLAGDAWWLGTIMLFAPRWPLLAPIALVAATHAVLRSKWLAVDLMAALVVAGPVMGLGVSFGGAAPADIGALKVMTANIGGADLAQLRAEIDRVRPDVVALQECNPTVVARVFGSSWQTVVAHNLCIASHFPTGPAEALPADQLGRNGNVALRTEIDAPQGKFWVVCLHLETPRWGLEELAVTRRGLIGVPELVANTHRRAHESEVVRKWTDEVSGPLITAGDFNMPVESRIYGKYWARFTNAFAKVGSGYGHTKLTRWHGVRIDHVLLRDLDPIACVNGDDFGGDHRPVVATTVLRPAGI